MVVRCNLKYLKMYMCTHLQMACTRTCMSRVLHQSISGLADKDALSHTRAHTCTHTRKETEQRPPEVGVTIAPILQKRILRSGEATKAILPSRCWPSILICEIMWGTQGPQPRRLPGTRLWGQCAPSPLTTRV